MGVGSDIMQDMEIQWALFEEHIESMLSNRFWRSNDGDVYLDKMDYFHIQNVIRMLRETPGIYCRNELLEMFQEELDRRTALVFEGAL